jgi:hypothetical protein
MRDAHRSGFQKFGPQFAIAFGSWAGGRLGLFTRNELEETSHVDVDFSRYDYDDPKAEKQFSK